MPKFAANLSTLYGECGFLDRFAAAAADGFTAVECQFPYAHPAAELRQRLRDHGLAQVLINAPPGDADRGDRGLAALPGREAEFRRSIVDQALPYAQALGCRLVHVMSGVVPPGADPRALHDTLEHNLHWATQQAASAGVTLLVEPLNPRDVPGYVLNRQDQAHALVQSVGSPHLKVQMDLYHCQVVEGDIAMKLRHWLPGGNVGHLQVSGVPERHEPDLGEVNFDYLFRLIDELGWAGHVGAEYRPRAGTSAGLGWFQPWRQARP